MQNYQIQDAAKMTELMLQEIKNSDQAFRDSQVLFLLDPGQYLNFVDDKRFTHQASPNTLLKYYRKFNRKIFNRNKGGKDGQELEI